ncbi:S1C family serine protease [Nocardia seriolae]|nr:trypsin-like peptidase domain-containing protein [Nocardia seriolae]MTJ66268.1 PDZ domain-containing protein [Nocardia seriolae]MTJ69910.1 PDZ domain-containing protein [Nocardia seriolae]MTJ85819.1 PDZ domain-containing protein [Nocardia seriolae]MTK29815.1 PDZ domain-containing protein [Nocardia seriolae]MTK44261.1 PDZ domain-containing protein [Nocardia seriolae]
MPAGDPATQAIPASPYARPQPGPGGAAPGYGAAFGGAQPYSEQFGGAKQPTEEIPVGTEQIPAGAYGQAYAASGAGYATGQHPAYTTGQHPAYATGQHPTQVIPGAPGGPGMPYPGAPAPKRSGKASLVAGAVVLALLSGGLGGGVVALATRNDSHSAVTNALDQPMGGTGKTTPAPDGSVQAVAQKVLPSVVMIRVAGARAEGEGSGVILSSDGLILTNNHVVSGAGANAKMDVAFSDGTTAPATVVGADSVSDIAVIRVTGKTDLKPIELGQSANLAVGQGVVAIGSPLGLAGTVTSGIVSSLNRPVSTSGEPGSQGTVIDAIQTDAAINPGNSGGALVDMNGKLIGINTAIATMGTAESAGAQSGSIGLGFAIPVDTARRVADELIKNGKATYAQIGITVKAQDDVNGARVIDVSPDGPAAKAGIPKNAIITKIDDQIVDSGNSLIAGVRSHRPGDKVKVTYTDDQGKNPKTVEVTLGEAAAEGGR